MALAGDAKRKQSARPPGQGVQNSKCCAQAAALGRSAHSEVRRQVESHWPSTFAASAVQEARLLGSDYSAARRHIAAIRRLRIANFEKQGSRLHALVRDISVVPRDVVRAGLSDSRRESSNFHILQRLLKRHKTYVSVLSLRGNDLVRHDLGFPGGFCCGVIFWDLETRHVFPLQEHVQLEPSCCPGPWFFSSVGGKRPKAKPKPKAEPKEEKSVEDSLAEMVESKKEDTDESAE